MFVNALMAVALNTILSFLAGIRTHCVYIYEYNENVMAILRSLNGFAAPANSTPEINSTISSLKARSEERRVGKECGS